MPMIVMAVIFVFALILILIILLVIYYNIKNFMEENLTNIGVLKASGYSNKELSLSQMLELSIVCSIGCFVGICIGLICSPLLGTIESAMMGILWRIGFDLRASLISIAIVFGMVLLMTLTLGQKYKKILVLEALRGGISSHTFRKNHFPLEHTSLALLHALGLKDVLWEKRKNICIAVIIAFLSFASCCGIFLYQGFGNNAHNMLNLSGIEVSDVILSTPEPRYNEFDPTTIEGVKSVSYGHALDLFIETSKKSVSVNCDY